MDVPTIPDNYAPATWTFAGYSEENGQALIKTKVCTRWECQKWCDDQKIAPKLAKNDKGFWVCTNCGGSYGTM